MATSNPLGITSGSAKSFDKPFHVVAAIVAANLGHAEQQAEAIALEAMNAKVLVAKAGDRALGFRPIADFMIELAENTIRIVGEINENALQLSSASVSKVRSGDAVIRFGVAERLSETAAYRESLNASSQSVRDEDRRQKQALSARSEHLVALLDQINHHLRASAIVTSTARTEVANLEDGLRASFQTVINKLESATESISGLVAENKRFLNRSTRSQEASQA